MISTRPMSRAACHELYEPLAEDDGMTLKVKTEASANSRQS